LIENLEQYTLSSITRTLLLHHQSPGAHIQNEIRQRFLRNCGKEFHYQGPGEIPQNIKSLQPGISPLDMLKILRLKEVKNE
jgi:hypothetical protein